MQKMQLLVENVCEQRRCACKRGGSKALRLSFRFNVLYSCNMFVFEFYGRVTSFLLLINSCVITITTYSCIHRQLLLLHLTLTLYMVTINFAQTIFRDIKWAEWNETYFEQIMTGDLLRIYSYILFISHLCIFFHLDLFINRLKLTS